METYDMKYIDENTRNEIKKLIEHSERIKNSPQKIKNNKSLISIIKSSEYYDTLNNILVINSNFETVGYLLRCVLENKDLLSCNTCGKELTYSQSFKSSGNFGHHCSCKCAQNDPILREHIQNQLTSYYMEHYGVTNVMQLSSSVLKAKETFIEHYGVDNNMKSERGQQEHKKSMQDKYGVDYTWQLSSVQEKSTQTNLNKYGFEIAIKNYEIKKKAFNNRTKSYYYTNIHFDSAPELALYIYLTDNNVKFEYQPNASFSYKFNNIEHKYFPDFKIENDFYEIKGSQFLKKDGTWQNPFDHSQDLLFEAKHQCALSNNVIILYSENYQKYLDYVDQKYGKGYLCKFKSK